MLLKSLRCVMKQPQFTVKGNIMLKFNRYNTILKTHAVKRQMLSYYTVQITALYSSHEPIPVNQRV